MQDEDFTWGFAWQQLETSYWSPGEPSNPTNHCVHYFHPFEGDDASWNDVDCKWTAIGQKVNNVWTDIPNALCVIQ